MWQNYSSEADCYSSGEKVSCLFLKPEVSLLCWQQSATVPHREPDEPVHTLKSTSWRSIWAWFSHLCLGLPNSYFPSGFAYCIIHVATFSSFIVASQVQRVIKRAVPLPPCRRQGGEYGSYSFLTSELDGSGQRHAQAALYPQERNPGTHWVGDWVGLRAGLDTEARGKILCLCQGSSPGRPVCS
jgi:hypothetical protein